MHLFQSNVSMGEALGYSVLGMAIVFAVLIVLMLVVKMMETFTAKGQNAEAPAPVSVSAAPAPAETAPAKPAPGTAGQLKLYNVEEQDAAMLMAIVADSLGKPLNELRFISIREVTDQ
ncbi:MAG: OadG family protein [Oscillospiraceae bacterium]|jgi:Na+-transporting methylmalonyl-CoA/oxaloacetate decarboxylase gamma subunit|nr:OadG family protein [Oscillospiraceae bacterium]